MTKAFRAFAMLALVIGSFAGTMSTFSAQAQNALPIPNKGWALPIPNKGWALPIPNKGWALPIPNKGW